MTYSEIKNICKKGKIGIVPEWKGYLKWDYSSNLMIFTNNNQILKYEKELEDQLKNKNNLYYII